MDAKEVVGKIEEEAKKGVSDSSIAEKLKMTSSAVAAVRVHLLGIRRTHTGMDRTKEWSNLRGGLLFSFGIRGLREALGLDEEKDYEWIIKDVKPKTFTIKLREK